MPVVETHAIKWICGRCRATGTLPHLDHASIDDVRRAIDRGHDRRSRQCHEWYGVRHVEAIQNGMRLRFAG